MSEKKNPPNLGYDEDFADAINNFGAQSMEPGKGLPDFFPHPDPSVALGQGTMGPPGPGFNPQETGQVRSITDADMEKIERNRALKDLGVNPKMKDYRVRFGSYNMSHQEDRDVLEDIFNSVLAEGVIMGREEWNQTPKGDTVITVKYFVPRKKQDK